MPRGRNYDLRFGDCELQVRHHKRLPSEITFMFNGERADHGMTEIMLRVLLFIAYPSQTARPAQDIFNAVWPGDKSDGFDQRVQSYLVWVRNGLERVTGQRDFIKNHRNMGYSFTRHVTRVPVARSAKRGVATTVPKQTRSAPPVPEVLLPFYGKTFHHFHLTKNGACNLIWVHVTLKFTEAQDDKLIAHAPILFKKNPTGAEKRQCMYRWELFKRGPHIALTVYKESLGGDPDADPDIGLGLFPYEFGSSRLVASNPMYGIRLITTNCRQGRSKLAQLAVTPAILFSEIPKGLDQKGPVDERFWTDLMDDWKGSLQVANLIDV